MDITPRGLRSRSTTRIAENELPHNSTAPKIAHMAIKFLGLFAKDELIVLDDLFFIKNFYTYLLNRFRLFGLFQAHKNRIYINRIRDYHENFFLFFKIRIDTHGN